MPAVVRERGFLVDGDDAQQNHRRQTTRRRRRRQRVIAEPAILVAWRPMKISATDVVLCGKKVGLDGSSIEWHTSPITHRVSKRLLETKSGKRYQLHGPPVWEQALPGSASSLRTQHARETLMALFRDGFPRDWYTAVLAV